MPRTPIPPSSLDRALTAQLAVAWAGEAGKEQRRLGWWQTDLISEYGGDALFEQLLPNTFEWATWQAARLAAMRTDETCRRRVLDSDQLLSLFHLGFDVDERVEERLAELKAGALPPIKALPALELIVGKGWRKEHFETWLAGHATRDSSIDSAGRRLHGNRPDSLSLLLDHLVGALMPLTESYSLPHYRIRA